MKQIDLVQVNHFKCIHDALSREGCRTDRMLKSSGLYQFDLDSPDTYVPVQCMYDFLSAAKRQEGIDDLLGIFSHDIHYKNNYDNSSHYLEATDLLAMIQLGIKYGHLNHTSSRDSLEINGYRAKSSIHIYDKAEAGMSESIQLYLGFILSLMKSLFGSEWTPDEIHLPLARVPNLDYFIPSDSNIKIKTHQAALAFVYPTSTLGRPFEPQDPGSLHTGDEALLSTRAKIEKLLDGTFDGIVPTLDHLAGLLDTNPRTLQRRLKEEHITYSELVDHWRFKKAVGLLSQPHRNISEIGQILGYQSVQNFYHAFQRWTNTTPGLYREAL